MLDQDLVKAMKERHGKLIETSRIAMEKAEELREAMEKQYKAALDLYPLIHDDLDNATSYTEDGS